VVELKQGISAGERIIVDGTGKLRAGLKVAATDAAPASGTAPAKTPAAAPAEGNGG